MPRVHDQYSVHFPEQNPAHFHHNHVDNVVKDIVGRKGTDIAKGVLLLETATTKEVTKTNRDLRNFVTTYIEILEKTFDLKEHSARFHALKAKFEGQTKAHDESQATATARAADSAAQLRLQAEQAKTAGEHEAATAARNAADAARAAQTAAEAHKAAAEEQLKVLRVQVQTAEAHAETLTGKLSAADQAAVAMKEKLAGTEELLTKTADRATKAAEEIAALQARLDAALHTIETATAEQKGLSEKNAAQAAELIDAQNALKAKEGETTALKARLEEQAQKPAVVEVVAQQPEAPAALPEAAPEVLVTEEAEALPQTDHAREIAKMQKRIKTLLARAEQAEAFVYSGVTLPKRLRS